MVRSLAWALLLCLADHAAAVPAVAFPFNSQLPPVARIDQPYSYQLLPQTFSSSRPLTYSLGSTAPTWLGLGGEGLLTGTPPEDQVPKGDVVGVPFEIVASDGAGSMVLNSTLVVARGPAPTINVPLSRQIEKFGEVSLPSSLLLRPSAGFSFAFAADTFAHQSSLIVYYAVSGDHSPMPSWVKFDADSLTFSGTTPQFESLVQPPQTFDFRLVASDVVGFSATAIPFSIVVGEHELTISDSVVTLNATRGSPVAFEGLLGEVKLDGQLIQPGTLNVSTSGCPSWLTVDTETLNMKGTPPESAEPGNFTITLKDSHLDFLNVTVVVDFGTALFKDMPTNLNATADSLFKLDISQHLSNPGGTTLNIQSQPSQNWLILDGLVLSGTPPASEAGVSIAISIKATSKSTGQTDSQTTQLYILPATSPSAPDSTSSTSRRLTPGEIALAVILPVLFLATALVIVCVLVRRRRRRQNQTLPAQSRRRRRSSRIKTICSFRSSRKLSVQQITGPVPGSFIRYSSGGGPSLGGFDFGWPAGAAPAAAGRSASTLLTDRTSGCDSGIDSGTTEAGYSSGSQNTARRHRDSHKPVSLASPPNTSVPTVRIVPPEFSPIGPSSRNSSAASLGIGKNVPVVSVPADPGRTGRRYPAFRLPPLGRPPATPPPPPRPARSPEVKQMSAFGGSEEPNVVRHGPVGAVQRPPPLRVSSQQRLSGYQRQHQQQEEQEWHFGPEPSSSPPGYMDGGHMSWPRPPRTMVTENWHTLERGEAR